MLGTGKITVIKDIVPPSSLSAYLMAWSDSLMTPFDSQIKTSKKFARFSFFARISNKDWQCTDCWIKSLGAIRLAITTIAGLMVHLVGIPNQCA